MPVRDLTNDFIRATSSAALAAYEWVGKGDGKAADGAAVESMRSVFDSIPFNGRVAIGEGERDDAPMLWIGEMLGSLRDDPRAEKIDIAVDPLECTNHVAYNKPNAMAVLAAAPRARCCMRLTATWTSWQDVLRSSERLVLRVPWSTILRLLGTH